MGFRNMTKRGRVMQINNVPNGWSIKRLGDILSITSCKRVHESEWTTSGVPFYRARELVALHDKLPIEPLFISEELYEKNTKLSGCIQAGDLLVTGVGTIGIQYLVKPGDRFYFKDGNIIWLKNEDKINGEFLYYSFDGQFIRKQILNAAGVGTVGTYTIDNAKKTYVMVPPIKEQEKIAEILGTWDRAIEELTDLIAEKKELKRGLMQRLLTGTQRLPGFTKPWNQKKILEFVHVGKIIIEKGKTLTAEQLNTGDIPVIAGGKTVPYYHDKYTHDIPCVTVSASGAYAGYVWWHNSKIWASDCNVLYGVNFDTRFLGLCLENMQKQIYRMQTGGAQPHVYADTIKTLKIPDVDLAEQKAIADVLSKADAEIDLLNQQLGVLKEQKRGLMQKLLTGEIRVKVDME